MLCRVRTLILTGVVLGKTDRRKSILFCQRGQLQIHLSTCAFSIGLSLCTEMDAHIHTQTGSFPTTPVRMCKHIATSMTLNASQSSSVRTSNCFSVRLAFSITYEHNPQHSGVYSFKSAFPHRGCNSWKIMQLIEVLYVIHMREISLIQCMSGWS